MGGLLFVGPWAAFMLWTLWPTAQRSVLGLEIPDTFNFGYFLIKLAALLLAMLALAQALLDLRRHPDGERRPVDAARRRDRAAGDRLAGLCRADGGVGRLRGARRAERRRRLRPADRAARPHHRPARDRPAAGTPALRLHGRVVEPSAARRSVVPMRCGAWRQARRRSGAGDARPRCAAGADERLGRSQRRHAVAQRGSQALGTRCAARREHGAGLRRIDLGRRDPALARPDPVGRRNDARSYGGVQRHQGDGAHRQYTGHLPRRGGAGRAVPAALPAGRMDARSPPRPATPRR